MSKNNINYIGGIENRSFYVKIGGVLDQKESMFLQEIKISIFIKFKTPPIGMQSDNLNDVYCYQKIIDSVGKFCELSQLILIEHFLYELKVYIKQEINFKSEDEMNIKITKVNTSGFFEINEFTK